MTIITTTVVKSAGFDKYMPAEITITRREFYDVIHLNGDRADKFSKMLNEDIIKKYSKK